MLIGGSACPRAMIEKFEKNYGVTVAHAWGMTEMNPIGSICAIKPDYDANDYEKLLDVKSKQGAAPFTVEMKIVDDSEKELPWDGKTVRPPQGEGRRGREVLFQGRGRQDPRSRTASSTPATSRPSIRSATCRSPTAPRT